MPLDNPTDERGHERKTSGSQSPGKSVIDGTSCLLVLKAKGGHHRLIGKLNHVNERVDYENQDLAFCGKKKHDRTRKNYEDGNEDKASVGQSSRLVNHSGNERLEDCGNDIRDRKKDSDLCV